MSHEIERKRRRFECAMFIVAAFLLGFGIGIAAKEPIETVVCGWVECAP